MAISGLQRGAMWALVSGTLVLSAAMGVRQTFGLFIGPIAAGGVPVGLIAFAIALHNLVWGFAQPFAGAAADRYGACVVVAFGAIALAAGLALSAVAMSGWMLVVGMGLLVGVGISCTTFGVVLPAVGRAVTAEKRSMALGLASAGGSVGQVVLVPLAQGVTGISGVAAALMVLAVLVVVIAPLGFVLDGGRSGKAVAAAGGSLGGALDEAMRHSGFRLLTLGFFTCGFQLAFISIHLPGYLTLCHMPVGLGATALALIGVFNIAGSWACGWLGGRFPQQHILGWLYLIRGAAIVGFFVLPKTGGSVVAFAAVMGLTWLGTVPLTSGFLAKVFGTRYLGTLFGVCFLSHQIGSFLGAWLGGFVLELTGSYALVWEVTALAGVMAAVLNFMIRDEGRPLLPELVQA